MSQVRDYIVATIQREMEQFAADDAEVATHLAGRRSRQVTGPSAVFSVRLDHDEIAALERVQDAVAELGTLLGGGD